jgi:hypothetical protein
MMSCSYPNCAGKGFQVEDSLCPGSDSEEEGHHCSLCGWMCWDPKSLICDECRSNYCGCCWQHTFVWIDCEDLSEVVDTYEYLCTPCFFSSPRLWCENTDCDCSQKIDQVRQTWANINEMIKREDL